MRYLFSLLKESFILWIDRGGETLAAAVSYYAMFALVPLIFFSIYLVSQVFGTILVTEIMRSWGGGLGTGVLTLLETAVIALPASPGMSLAPIGSLVFFAFAVLMFFNTLTEGFHRLWGTSATDMRGYLKKSGRALLCFCVLQLFIVGLIAAEFGFTLLFDGIMFKSYALMGVYIGAMTLLFTIFYSILPLGNVPPLRSRLYGAVLAATLFLFTKTLVQAYIALTPVPDLFGAAGIALVLLLWVYVSTTFIYYGAAFAAVHDRRRSPERELTISPISV